MHLSPCVLLIDPTQDQAFLMPVMHQWSFHDPRQSLLKASFIEPSTLEFRSEAVKVLQMTAVWRTRIPPLPMLLTSFVKCEKV